MIYDLSHPVNADTPVYPGDPGVVIEPVGTISKDGFCDHSISLGSHAGTHIDAPAHMLEGGKQLRDYPIERFVVPAVCLDARTGFLAEAIAKQAIPGGAVLFYTGASDYFHESRYYEDYPVLDDTAVEALVEARVTMVGLDTGSADSDENFPVHKALLGADILIIENLADLQPLIGKQFRLHALPLKLEMDGAPTRVVAETDE